MPAAIDREKRLDLVVLALDYVRATVRVRHCFDITLEKAFSTFLI